jgi:hypothetical protein
MQKQDHSIGFKKSAFFRLKLAKIAEISDRSIDLGRTLSVLNIFPAILHACFPPNFFVLKLSAVHLRFNPIGSALPTRPYNLDPPILYNCVIFAVIE